MNKLMVLLLTLVPYVLLSQDSLSMQVDINLLGRRQTGNLDQFSFAPSGSLEIGSSDFRIKANANYHLLEVEGFRSINDFWWNTLFQLGPANNVYPMAIVYHGFADSYRIRQSIISGAGVGLNVIDFSLQKYFQIHIFGGYADVEFTEIPRQSSASIGSYISSGFPIHDGKLNLLWEFHTYHSLQNPDFKGVNNIIRIRYALIRNLFFNLSHTTIFNDTVNAGIAKTNTLMMFGLTYSHFKNLKQK